MVKQFKEASFLTDNSRWMGLTNEAWQKQRDAILLADYLNSAAILSKGPNKLDPLLKNAKHLRRMVLVCDLMAIDTARNTQAVQQLTKIGVSSTALSITSFCTACRRDHFYSHRAEEGQTGRMLSFIALSRKA